MAKTSTSKRRQPTLADRFQHYTPQIADKKTVDQVRNRVRSAHRFVLDAAATRRYAEIVRDVPDLLIREQQFARAPYDVTWVEFDFSLFWPIVNLRPAGADRQDDQMLGYLIDHGTGYVVADGMLVTIAYDLHRQPTFEEELAVTQASGVSRGFLDDFTWGTVIKNLPPEQYRSLRGHHTCRLLPLATQDQRRAAALRHTMMSESVADLRNIIAILLLMNRPSLTRYVRELDGWRGFTHGKMRPFMSHTVVTIDVDPIPTLRKIGTAEGEGIARRRHEVRGHYCHNRDAHEYAKIGCVHDWQGTHPDWTPVDDDFAPDKVDHWVCRCCGSKRWWRDEHARGTSQVGFVDKEYDLTH